MSATVATIEALLERFEEIERRNRRRWRVSVTALILAGSAVALATIALVPRLCPKADHVSRAESVVEAERFVLRDGRGTVHAEMAVEAQGGASLTIFDRGGPAHVRLGPSGFSIVDSRGFERAGLRMTSGAAASDPADPVLFLSDAAGKPRGTLTVFSDGSSRLLLSDQRGTAGASVQTDAKGFARLAITDANGGSAAWLGALPDGSRAFVMADGTSAARIMMTVAGGGMSDIALHDRMGKERAILSLLPEGTPIFRLSGREARGSVALGVTATGGAVLELVDEHGKAGTSLATQTGSSGLMIRDNAGKSVAALISDAGRWPRLLLSGDGENIGALLTVSPKGASGLALHDSHGRPRAVLGQASPARPRGPSQTDDRAPFSLTFLDRDGKVIKQIPR